MNRGSNIIFTVTLYYNILFPLFWHHCVCNSTSASVMTITSPANLLSTRDNNNIVHKCNSVNCSKVEDCPPDSYRIPTSPNMTVDGCQCLPKCESSHCPSDTIAIIEFAATGEPGRCCHLYKCQKLVTPVQESINEEDHVYELGSDSIEVNPNTDLNSDSEAGCTTEQYGLVKHGFNWTTPDSCVTCTCNDGVATCVTPACKPCVQSIILPDQCCPVCKVPHVQPDHCPPVPNCTERCLEGNQLDENGCVTCKCKIWKWHNTFHSNGSDTIQVALPCKTEENGILRDDGELWLDGCRRHCGCVSGEEMCSLIQCPAISCSNPIYNRTMSCCPVCLTTRNKQESEHVLCARLSDVLALEGEFVIMGSCIRCICRNGQALCHAKRCPPTPCSRPLLPGNGECCPTCPATAETVGMNNLTEEQHPPYLKYDERCQQEDSNCSTWREGSCTSCRCEEAVSRLAINDIQLPHLQKSMWYSYARCYTESCDIRSLSKCQKPLVVKGRCCAICLDDNEKLNLGLDVNLNWNVKLNLNVDIKVPQSFKTEDQLDCVYDNASYELGNEWNKDACTKCRCENGQIKCWEKMCSQPCTRLDNILCCSSCPSEGDGMVAGWSASTVRVMKYVVPTTALIILLLIITAYVSRHFRYQKQQIRLHDFGRSSLQYQHVPTSPYDTACSAGKIQILSAQRQSVALV